MLKGSKILPCSHFKELLNLHFKKLSNLQRLNEPNRLRTRLKIVQIAAVWVAGLYGHSSFPSGNMNQTPESLDSDIPSQASQGKPRNGMAA